MSLAVKLLSWNKVRSWGDGKQLVNSTGVPSVEAGTTGHGGFPSEKMSITLVPRIRETAAFPRAAYASANTHGDPTHVDVSGMAWATHAFGVSGGILPPCAFTSGSSVGFVLILLSWLHLQLRIGRENSKLA